MRNNNNNNNSNNNKGRRMQESNDILKLQLRNSFPLLKNTVMYRTNHEQNILLQVPHLTFGLRSSPTR